MLDKLRDLSRRYAELEARLQEPGFAANRGEYARALKELGGLSRKVGKYREYEATLRRISEAEKILNEERDAELHELAREELVEFRRQEEALLADLAGMMSEDEAYAGKDLIVEIRAGTGGDEASLFCGDLFRMYHKFADAHGLKVEVLAASGSEVGGFKEMIFSVSGADAWRLLRFESGGHRVQRVPVTESQGRIHTSAATVAVLPEAEEVEVNLQEQDLRIDTYCASGPGGQNVNKVATAIRITHKPTGLVVQCQDESSQHKNRSKALRILTARLFDMERERQEQERAQERRTQIGTGDRNMRVRTYNFPQNRVTDHRSKTSYSLEMVIEGRLDPIVEDLTQWQVQERLKAR